MREIINRSWRSTDFGMHSVLKATGGCITLFLVSVFGKGKYWDLIISKQRILEVMSPVAQRERPDAGYVLRQSYWGILTVSGRDFVIFDPGNPKVNENIFLPEVFYVLAGRKASGLLWTKSPFLLRILINVISIVWGTDRLLPTYADITFVIETTITALREGIRIDYCKKRSLMYSLVGYWY